MASLTIPSKEQAQTQDNTPQDFSDLFRLIDKDGDGSVTAKEIRVLLKSMGLYTNNKEIKSILKAADTSNNGKIELDEFIQYMEKKVAIDNKRTSKETKILRLFAVFDKNGDGCIDHDELKTILRNTGEDISDEEVDAIMSEVDTDNTGTIDYEEFKEMLKLLS